MRAIQRDSRGFTLIEMLVVVAIFGVVVSAVYSLYLTHLKNAYTQEDVVEVQQNLRIAMDAITRDVKNAGVLCPLSTAPLGAGVQNTYTTSVTLNSASAEKTYARVVSDTTSPAMGNFSTSVDSSTGFSRGDRVRFIRTFDNSNIFSGYTTLMVAANSPLTGGSLYLVRDDGTSVPSGQGVKAGDMIARAGSSSGSSTASGRTDSILYSLVTNAQNSNCPAKQLCLARSVDGGTADIVAGDMKSLQLRYVLDDGTDTNAPTDPTKITAIRVTVSGQTTVPATPASPAAGVDYGGKTRSMTSLIMLRNRR